MLPFLLLLLPLFLLSIFLVRKSSENSLPQEEVLGMFGHVGWDVRMDLVESNFEHRCLWTAQLSHKAHQPLMSVEWTFLVPWMTFRKKKDNQSIKQWNDNNTDWNDLGVDNAMNKTQILKQSKKKFNVKILRKVYTAKLCNVTTKLYRHTRQ